MNEYNSIMIDLVYPSPNLSLPQKKQKNKNILSRVA